MRTINEVLEIAQEAGFLVVMIDLGVGIEPMKLTRPVSSTDCKQELGRFADLVDQRNPWKAAVLGALDICMIRTPENSIDPEHAMSDLMAWDPPQLKQPIVETAALPPLDLLSGIDQPLVRIGNTSTNYMQWDGTTLTVQGSPLAGDVMVDKLDTTKAEGKGLNPYFEGQFDGESDELRSLRLMLVKGRDEA